MNLQDLIKEYNRVPVIRKVWADMETPLSAYLKLANKSYTYLFESVKSGKYTGRYSIIGLQCDETLQIYGNEIIYTKGENRNHYHLNNPLQEIKKMFFKRQLVHSKYDLPYDGGMVGYFGYDAVRFMEKKLQNFIFTDYLKIPDIMLMLSYDFIIFDNLLQNMYLVTLIDPQVSSVDQAETKLDQWYQQMSSTTSEQIEKKLYEVIQQPANINFFMEEEQYKDAVSKIIKYIKQGDAMQVVLSQRMSTAFQGNPINLYRRLRKLNPSPYMFYLHLKNFYIVGASPEILISTRKQKMVVKPLAGTRKRGETVQQDLAIEQELLNDPKEIAEHLMLIDLARNDLSRIAKYGSVNVVQKMAVERYSHVMHISSTVEGIMLDDLNVIEVLSAVFPAGTLSGAPKIRAMEIIDELETVKRGVYGGAVGHIGWNGDIDMAIVLRTAIIKDGILYNQAGAGIVYDSNPASEWQETMIKSKAIFATLRGD